MATSFRRCGQSRNLSFYGPKAHVSFSVSLHREPRFLSLSPVCRMEEAYPSFQPIPWQLLSLLPSPATHPPPSHVSWEQTAAAHLYSADLPGVRKEDIRVEVEDLRYLIIRTELDDDDDERSFIRKFRLPGMVDVDGISAEYTHGVLTVTVPRMHTRAAPRINLVSAGPGCDSVARAA